MQAAVRYSHNNLSNCIPCPCHTYMRCLSAFSGCEWAYGFTFTSLAQQTLPQICERWLKSELMQVCKPCHYKAVEPFKLHHMFMHSYMWCLSTFSSCGWDYGFTFASLAPQMFAQICDSWVKSYLMQVCLLCHFALIEAVVSCKLHPMTMSYIYEVFERLLRLCMGIWLHTHTITTTDVSLDL